ncbi:MAG: amidohydrolase family protein, partial [Gammaproteobacteria bacterium]
MRSNLIPVFGILCSLIACEKSVQDPLTTVFVNGNILTMDDDNPVVESLAERDGRILAIGDRLQVEKVSGNNIRYRDMKNATLLPGFIDSHGHISAVISFMAFENAASPPVGEIRNIADLQNLLTARAAEVPAGEWIMAAGYDDSLLKEQRHPTKFDLDAVSTEHPIMVWHVSGHLMVCNSLCLEIAGIS